MRAKKIKALIKTCREEIENIKSLPYYRVFNRQEEQEADLKEIEGKLARYNVMLINRQLN